MLRLVVILIFSSQMAHAISEVNLAKGNPGTQGQSVFLNEKIGKVPYKRLLLVKQAYYQKQYRKCLKLLKGMRRSYKVILPHVYLKELTCVQQIPKKAKSEWQLYADLLTNPPQEIYSEVELLNKYYAEVKGNMPELLVEMSQLDKARAWKVLDKLLYYSSLFSSSQLSTIYSSAGELAFAQQRMKLALQYWKQSLSYSDDQQIKKKYARLKQELGIKTDEPEDKATPVQLELDLKYSEKETKLYDQVMASINSGKVVTAFEDAVDLFKDFSGSEKLEQLKSPLRQAYRRLFSKKEKKYDPLKRKVSRSLRGFSTAVLNSWVGHFYRSDRYDLIVSLSEEMLRRIPESDVDGETLLLMGKSAVHIEDFDSAEKLFDKLIESYSGSSATEEARFRLGAVLIRKGEHLKAMSQFERLLKLTTDDRLRSKTYYWLWRCHQIVSSPGAQKVAQELQENYPFYYYGIRARAESNDNKLSFTEGLDYKVGESRRSFTDAELMRWKRYTILAKGGWYKEAAMELNQISAPSSPKDKVAWLKLYTSINHYNEAVRLAINAWEEESALKHPVMLQYIFPQKFKKLIDPIAEKWNVHPLFILSIIRQESLFDWEAKSSAGALGLMQIILPTARDIKGWLRMNSLELPGDLKIPEINLQMGTHYIFRLIRKYKGNVPMALSAYNAGPGNTDRWLRGRVGLADEIAKNNGTTSVYTSDLWFEELPWDETNTYITRILRNWMVYQAFDTGEFKLGDPLWKGATLAQFN